ncbi:hypothetical protein TNCV_652041 [Trichonephila clavipes]|nr:hypothetical protein TNCV_652041 [Trichonephila clavipes]
MRLWKFHQSKVEDEWLGIQHLPIPSNSPNLLVQHTFTNSLCRQVQKILCGSDLPREGPETHFGLERALYCSKFAVPGTKFWDHSSAPSPTM